MHSAIASASGAMGEVPRGIGAALHARAGASGAGTLCDSSGGVALASDGGALTSREDSLASMIGPASFGVASTLASFAHAPPSQVEASGTHAIGHEAEVPPQ